MADEWQCQASRNTCAHTILLYVHQSKGSFTTYFLIVVNFFKLITKYINFYIICCGMDVISMFAIVCYSQESVHSSQNRIKNLCQSKRWTQNFSVSIHSTAQLSNNTPMDQCRGKAHHTAVLVQYSWPWFIDWQMTYHSVFKWQETTSMCQAPSHSALHWQPLATRLFVFHSSSRTAHQWLVSKLVTQLTSSVFF